MKVYQVRETGGEWEDYYDIAHETYSTREMAEKRVNELIRIEYYNRRQHEKCDKCSYILDEMEQKSCFKGVLKCENYICKFDDSEFRIVEIDVLEEVE